MRKQFFKRSVRTQMMIVVMIVILIIIIIIISIKGLEAEYLGTFYMLSVGSVFVAELIVCEVIPPDFKYYVRAEFDCITFEFSEIDHRPILRNYHEVNKDYYYMVLQDDRGAIISIPYNKEVLEFLKQVRIE